MANWSQSHLSFAFLVSALALTGCTSDSASKAKSGPVLGITPESGSPGYSPPIAANPNTAAPGAPIAVESPGQVLYNSMGFDTDTFDSTITEITPTRLLSNQPLSNFKDRDNSNLDLYNPPVIGPSRLFEYGIYYGEHLHQVLITKTSLTTGTVAEIEASIGEPVKLISNTAVYINSDDTKLVIHINGKIYYINLSTGLSTHLTAGLNGSHSIHSSGVKFSTVSDVAYIPVVTSPSLHPTIYRIDLVTSQRTQLITPIGPSGSFSSYKIAPDESFLVYSGNPNSLNPTRLYRVDTDGSNHAELTPTSSAPSSGGITQFLINGDSSKIAFSFDDTVAGNRNIYVVNSDGTNRLKLNSSLVSNGSLMPQSFNSNGTKLLYTGDQDSDEIHELYVAETDGSAVVKLNDTLPSNGDAYLIGISPDLSKIYFATDPSTDNRWNLVESDWAGSTKVTLLLQELVLPSISFFISSNSFIVWTNSDNNGRGELRKIENGVSTLLFDAPADYPMLNVPLASNPSQSSPSPNLNQAQTHISFCLSNSGGSARRVYRSSLNGSGSTVVLEFTSSSPIWDQSYGCEYGFPNDTLRIRTNLIFNFDGQFQFQLPQKTMRQTKFGKLSPNGSHVVYQRERTESDFKNIFSLDINSAANTRVTNWTSSLFIQHLNISPDSQFIHFVAIDNNFNSLVYRANTVGTGFSQIYGSDINFDHRDFSTDPTIEYAANNKLLFTSSVGDYQIRSLNPDGTGLSAVHPSLAEDAFYFKVSPNLDLVAYSAEQEVGSGADLYISKFDGTGNFKVNNALNLYESYMDDRFEFSPNSNLIAFLASSLISKANDLWIMGTNGTTRRRLTMASSNSRSVKTFNFSTSSSWLAFSGHIDSDTVTDLYAIRIDGTSRVKIGGTMASGEWNDWNEEPTHNRRTVLFKADDSAVFYAARKESAAQKSLYMATLNGAAIYRLNPLFTNPSGTVTNDFRMTPTESHLIYRADADLPGQFQLYSVELSTRKVRRISISLSTPVDTITSFKVASQSVIYRAVKNGKAALYTVRFDGTGHRRLHPALTGIATVSNNYHISESQKKVIFHGNLENPNFTSVYSATFD